MLLDAYLKEKRAHNYPELTPEKFFEFFTAEQVLKNFNLTDDELNAGIVGGERDSGIDGFYVLVDHKLVQEDTDLTNVRKGVEIELIIFQSTTRKGFLESAVKNFLAASDYLFNLSQTPAEAMFNHDLVKSILLFHNTYRKLMSRFPNLKIIFYYATKGIEVSSSIRHLSDTLKTKVKTFVEDAKVDFYFLGASELYDLASKQASTPCKLELTEELSSSNKGGWVCLVKLDEFFRFITDDGKLKTQLFETNVRDYQGHSPVNDEIQDSLRNRTSENFWWLNNGISIIATDATSSSKILTMREPQIVNGLQTSEEIYAYMTNNPKDDDDRTLLIRVMVTTDENSRDRIIKATNSQTNVMPASLKATDAVQGDIEYYFKTVGLFYDRRRNYYKNQKKPRNKIIANRYLVRAVMAIFLQRPNVARARPSAYMKDATSYKEIFNKGYPIEMYYVCVEGMRKVDAYLKSEESGVESKDYNNIRFYVAMHLIAGVKSKLGPSKIAEFDLKSINKFTLDESIKFVRAKYKKLGGNDQTAKSSDLLATILKNP